jgi:hypothetical protein
MFNPISFLLKTKKAPTRSFNFFRVCFVSEILAYINIFWCDNNLFEAWY